jgi:hypothetical protein
MLVSTVSLTHLLKEKKGEMTSEDILKTYWQKEGNLNSVIPPESFKAVPWEDLASTPYAVMSYQWLSKWGPMVEFILSALHELKQIICGLMCSVWIRWTRPR